MKFFISSTICSFLQIYSFLTCFIILKLDPVNIFTLPGGTMISLSEGYCRNAARGRDISLTPVFSVSKACTLQLSAGYFPLIGKLTYQQAAIFPVVHTLQQVSPVLHQLSIESHCHPSHRFLPTIPGQQHLTKLSYHPLGNSWTSPVRCKFQSGVKAGRLFLSLFFSWAFSFSPGHSDFSLHLLVLYIFLNILLTILNTLSPISN